MVTGPYSNGITNDLGIWTNIIKHHFLIVLFRNDTQPSTSLSSNEFVIIPNLCLERLKTKSPTRLTWVVKGQELRLGASHEKKTTYQSTHSQPVVVERDGECHAPQLQATEGQLMTEWEEESWTLQLKATDVSQSKRWEGPPTGRIQAQLLEHQRQLQSSCRYITAKGLPVATPRMKVWIGFQ